MLLPVNTNNGFRRKDILKPARGRAADKPQPTVMFGSLRFRDRFGYYAHQRQEVSVAAMGLLGFPAAMAQFVLWPRNDWFNSYCFRQSEGSPGHSWSGCASRCPMSNDIRLFKRPPRYLANQVLTNGTQASINACPRDNPDVVDT